jgi:D-beta-D-heptose 7-phosphate kinase/D-beta-D-heptose 1-phosphate adenosyltransferase
MTGKSSRKLVESTKRMTNSVIFTNGCFDSLHVGHINLLLLCRKWAGPDGQVVVGIDSDEKIRQDKGLNRPLFSIQERQQALLALKNGLDPIIDAVYGFCSNKK